MNKNVLAAVVILGVGFSACSNLRNSNSQKNKRKNGNFKQTKGSRSFKKH